MIFYPSNMSKQMQLEQVETYFTYNTPYYLYVIYTWIYKTSIFEPKQISIEI